MESDRAKSEEGGRQSIEALERIIEDLHRQNAEQRELFNSSLASWRADSKRHQEEIIDAIRSTANEQVPFNVQGYLDEFSKALAIEVRTLLNEVGRIREEKRALQYELGALLSMKAMYGPGGEFEPGWKPPGRPGGTDMPPPPMPQVRGSWATWAPDRNQVVTPPSVEPTLIIPELGSPGLFGPPSELSTDQWMPPRPPVDRMVAVLGRGSPGLFGLPSESTDWKNKPPGFPRSPPGTEMPPLPMPDTPQMRGWAAWAPDRNQVVTPPSVEPTLVIPRGGSPGLFGPPSESSTDWKPPGSPPGTDMPPPPKPDVPQVWTSDRNQVMSPSVESTLVIPGGGSPELSSI